MEAMEMKEIEAAVEGILFASGEPVAADRIAVALDLDRDTVDQVLRRLADYYSYERRGMRLVRMEDTWQLCSAPEYADLIRRAFEIRKPAKLSQPALEVLTIIAYYQPTTRAYVDQIRGVDSAYTVGLLLDRHLIEECARLSPDKKTFERVRIAFGDELRVTAAAGPVRMQIVPSPPKKPKKQKKHKEKKNPPEKQKAAPREKRKLGLTPGDIRSALPYLWQSLKGALRKTRQRLRVDPLRLSLVLGGEPDPAASAETYGWLSAAVWTFMPRLEELMRIPDPYIHLDVDYSAAETKAEGEVGLSFQIRDLFAIGFAFGIPVLKWLLRWKKEKKLREAAAQAEQAQTVQKTEETDGAKTPENDKKG